jgi:hypothetical protein
MINKIIVTLVVSIFVTQCGFSPIYVGNPKAVVVSKIEIIGDKNLAFDLERRLGFTKMKNLQKLMLLKLKFLIQLKTL